MKETCKNCIYWKNQNTKISKDQKMAMVITDPNLGEVKLGYCKKLMNSFYETDIDSPKTFETKNGITTVKVRKISYAIYCPENFGCIQFKQKS